MNTVAITINLPHSGAAVEEYEAALHQAIGERQLAGDYIGAAAIGGLVSHLARVQRYVAPSPAEYDWRKDPLKNGGNGY